MSDLVLQDVRKAFGDTPVLRGVDLDVRDGEFLSVVGPSGCGKSTLLRIVAGLEVQDSGSVSIGGRVVDDLRPKRRDVAMVFQSYALYPHMTVFENLALPLVMRRLHAVERLPVLGRFVGHSGRKRGEIAAEVRAVAKVLELDALLDRKPSQLSGGQRQRVAVGRAMVRRPKVFLMDEPLSNLDAKLRVQMRTEIAELHRRLGVTFIYVTHDQTEAMTMSDRVAVMMDGALLQVDRPRRIYADPLDRRVAEFIGSPKINCLPGQVVAGGSVDVAGTSFAVPARLEPGAGVTIAIRPEALAFTDRPEAGVLSGNIRLTEHMGAEVYVHVDVPGLSHPLVVRPQLPLRQSLERGQCVHLAPSVGSILLFDERARRIAAKPAEVMAMPTRARR